MTDNHEATSPTTAFDKTILVGKRGWLNRVTTGQSGDRLATALEIYYSEMKQFESYVISVGPKPAHCGFQSIASLLVKSADSLKRGDVELGWDAINAAQRIETQIYLDLSQPNNSLKKFAEGKIKARALSVWMEGNDKLGPWRKKTLITLLADGKGNLKEYPSELIQAQQILSEHHNNVYRRLKIFSAQIRILEMVAIITVVFWLAWLGLQPGNAVTIPDPYSLFYTVSSLVFGTLGACISGILRLENKSANQKIPEQLETTVHTVARPIIGAVSALAVVIFVLTGILDIGNQSPGVYLAAAFAAGFSERLLKFGMGQLADAEKEQVPPAPSKK
jgi:hypothetical protein